MSDLAQGLTILCTVASAMAAGTFFTFSTFAIEGLKLLPADQGAAAMQAINKKAPTPLFMLLLFGTGFACLVLLALALRDLQASGAVLRVVGCVVYLLGVVIPTVTYHVPRNDRLDGFDPSSAEGRAYWAVYLVEWVRMNHVRTLAPLATSSLLIASLLTSE